MERGTKVSLWGAQCTQCRVCVCDFFVAMYMDGKDIPESFIGPHEKRGELFFKSDTQ